MTGRFARRLTVALWLLLGADVGFSPAEEAEATLVAATGPACCRPLDQVWLISTRRLGCGGEELLPEALGVYRYEGHRWRQAEFADFLAADHGPGATYVWVHGNQISPSDAKVYGLQVYRRLVACAPPGVPLRYVIWSWPSDKQHGILRDVRAKAHRSDVDAVYFGWFLGQLDPATPATLAGYSFGARIVTGGLHLAAGGRLGGRTLESLPGERVPFRALLMAAAIDNDWLLPGRRHGLALSQVDRALMLNNGCDRALKRYHWLERDGDQALGYTGLAGARRLGPELAKVRQMNVCSIVGKQHDSTNYFASPRILGRIRGLTFADLPPAGDDLALAVVGEGEGPAGLRLEGGGQ